MCVCLAFTHCYVSVVTVASSHSEFQSTVHRLLIYIFYLLISILLHQFLCWKFII